MLLAVCLISTDGLALDWKILAREASFFAASLVAILVVLSDELKAEVTTAVSDFAKYREYRKENDLSEYDVLQYAQTKTA